MEQSKPAPLPARTQSLDPQPEAGEDSANEPVLRILPAGQRPALDLKELWEFRETIYFLFLRQIKVDYRQMALGPLWLLIRPALTALVYTLVFGMLADLPAEGKLPFPLFNFSAVVLWTFFSEAVKLPASSLVSYRIMMDKIYFPRLTPPLVMFATSVVNFSFSFLLLFPLIWYYGWPLSWTICLLPVYVALTGIMGLAVGIFVAPWLASYRDLNYFLDYLLLGWMYLCPIVYTIEIVPERFAVLYRLNPMTSAIQGFRWALLGVGDAPSLFHLLSFGLASACLLLGALAFRRAERSIVDVA